MGIETIPRVRAGSPAGSALCAGLLVLVAAAAYANALSGPFFFDDRPAIVNNPRIRSLWPPWRPLSAPRDTPVAGRPVVNASLAVNYALGGLDPRGYHLANLLVHAACGLVLFGLVRRTLETRPAPLRDDATGIALASAALWLSHPLASECVDYTTQRSESIMAGFYLLTLYSVCRTARAELPAARTRFGALAVTACALGMASKEAMVTAPLVALLYDTTYHAGSVAAALRLRRRLYLGLAAGWLLLLALHAGGPRAQSVGAVHGVGPGAYLANQVAMLAAYLWRVVWPHPLIVDYGWPRLQPWGEVAPEAALAVAVVGLALLAARWRPALGFPALAGLLVLAPTSSLVPIASEVGAERRMYLPLAGLAVLAVLGGRALLRHFASPGAARRLGAAWTATAVVLLGWVTHERNEDYRSAESIWRTVVAAIPDNPRALVNLGAALRQRGALSEAEALFEEALALWPPYGRAEAELAQVALARGDPEAAATRMRRALELEPRLGDVRTNLGELLAGSGHTAEAMAQWREALARDPELAYAANNLAWALATHPDAAERDGAEAVRLAQRAAALTVDNDAAVLDTLAAAYAEVGRFGEARAAARRAAALAASGGDAARAEAIRARLALYTDGRPYRRARRGVLPAALPRQTP